MKDKLDLIKESAENDLSVFIKLVAPHLMLGAVHEELIQWWTRSESKNNQLVLLPRGHMKSKLVAYRTAWWITRYPETTILYVSATADLAEKQLYAIKQIIDSPIYRRYWPEMINIEEGKREKWAVSEIAVDHPQRKLEGIRDATCKAVGLTSNTTGFHADVVVLDDIVVPGNAYTADGREKVESDTTQFYAQYYNNPNSEDTARINADKFQYFDKAILQNKEGDWYIRDRKLNIYAAIDFAFSLRKKADYTALVTIGVDHQGNFYILDIDRFKTDRIVEYYEHIVKSWEKWGFRKLRAEVTIAQQTIVKELKESYLKPNGIPLSIDEFRPTRSLGDKYERIAAVLEPKYDNLQIWHYKGGNCQSLEEELTMAHPPHDDIKDALANAISIAMIPKQRVGAFSVGKNIVTHSRFGGVSY